jgi:hypothetical protein
MAGKIVADTLEHSTAGSIATNYVVEGSAKAWANIDGTGTANLRDSFNISTLTDVGVSNYKLTFSSTMSTANYSPVASGNLSTANSGRTISCPGSTITTSEVDMKCFRTDTLASEDFAYAISQIHGDLA